MTLTERKEINKLAVLVANELNTLNESYKQSVCNLFNSPNEIIYLKNLTNLIEYFDIDKEKPEHKILYSSVGTVMCLSLSDYQYFITITELEYTILKKMKVKKLSETEYTVLDTVDNYRLKYNNESECYFSNEIIEKNQNELLKKIELLFNEGVNDNNKYKYVVINSGNEVDIRKLTFVDGKFISSELVYKFDFDDIYGVNGKMIINLREPIYGGE